MNADDLPWIDRFLADLAAKYQDERLRRFADAR
jgi:hypothetical protein